MNITEQMEKASRKYEGKVNKARYHDDLINAAMEYIGVLARLAEQGAACHRACEYIAAWNYNPPSLTPVKEALTK